MSTRLAVCAEMVPLGPPFEQRVRRLTELGYGALLCDWRTKDVDFRTALQQTRPPSSCWWREG